MFQKLDSYFSFGHLIFQKSKAQKVLSQIDLSRVFFETDDSEYSISEIYNKAQEIINLDKKKLIDSIFKNYRNIQK